MVKVAFIICYNDDIYMRECMDYISWLRVPNGVETEIIGITEAESMAGIMQPCIVPMQNIKYIFIRMYLS